MSGPGWWSWRRIACASGGGKPVARDAIRAASIRGASERASPNVRHSAAEDVDFERSLRSASDDGGRIEHASSFSRVIRPPSFAIIPLAKEGAERRQALGCLRAPVRRAIDAGPQAFASRTERAFAVRAPGDARLSALHRGDFLAPEPARDEASRRCLSIASWPASCIRGPLVVAEGGFPDASRVRGYEPRAQDTASRSDSGSSPETPSTNGTTVTVSQIEVVVNERLRLSIKLCAAAMRAPHLPGLSRQAHAQRNAHDNREYTVRSVDHSALITARIRNAKAAPCLTQRGSGSCTRIERDYFTVRRMSCERMRTASIGIFLRAPRLAVGFAVVELGDDTVQIKVLLPGDHPDGNQFGLSSCASGASSIGNSGT